MTAPTLGAEPAYPPPSAFPAHPGLTKRELLSAMAMQGLLANTEDGYSSINMLVHDATVYADALIAELQK